MIVDIETRRLRTIGLRPLAVGLRAFVEGNEAVDFQPQTRDEAYGLRTWEMVKRRATAAGLPYEITSHSFRGTGITEYLRGDGDRDVAAKIAGHESTRTTRLYDRRDDEVSLDEIERIHI